MLPVKLHKIGFTLCNIFDQASCFGWGLEHGHYVTIESALGLELQLKFSCYLDTTTYQLMKFSARMFPSLDTCDHS